MQRERREQDRRRAQLASALVSYALDAPIGAGLDAREIAAPAGEMGGQRGTKIVVLARQAAMYLCHVACGMTLSHVAQAFQRDRSTISHACHVVENRRDDPMFDAWIEALALSLRAAPGMADASGAPARLAP